MALPAAGIHDPKEVFAPLDEAIGQLWQEIDRLAPRYTFPASEALAKKQVQAEFKGAQVKASVMKDDGWTIVVNKLTSVPMARFRSGFVLYRVPGEKWYRQQGFTYTEAYQGGGRYAPASGVTLKYLRHLAGN